MLTGEPVPVAKRPGAQVVGGTRNQQGAFRFRATRVGADTALARIVAMVREAQSSKAPAQRLADLAGKYLVIVALAAVLEAAARVDTVVFDKTGTLTEGRPTVTDIVPAPGVSDAEVLQLAASADAQS